MALSYINVYFAIFVVVFILLIVAVLFRIKKKQSGKAKESGKKTELSRLLTIALGIIFLVMAVPLLYIVITG